jgi:UDPglucose--hexose-1-phosphate uridylyltransferase
MAQPPHNIAIKTKSLVAFCPDFSLWPYETWVQPIPRGKTFGQADQDQVKELAGLVQRIVQALTGAHPDLPYNFYIYPGSDWYLRIIGRSVTRAGFELGSGVMVNTIDPKEVVKILS